MEMWGKTRIEGMDGVILIWTAAAKLPLLILDVAVFLTSLVIQAKGLKR
jgi:hypothetical protein